MTPAAGSSPQGTDFFDTPRVTYVGGGRFVMTEERDCRAILFTYGAGQTSHPCRVHRHARHVRRQHRHRRGFVRPADRRIVLVKESGPVGISFQTLIHFSAGTALADSASTANPVNLFDRRACSILRTLTGCRTFPVFRDPRPAGCDSSANPADREHQPVGHRVEQLDDHRGSWRHDHGAGAAARGPHDGLPGQPVHRE